MNLSVGEQDIPKSFTASVDRPFDPIGKRDIYNAQFSRNNQRLTDEQVRQLQDQAPVENTNESRIDRLSREANQEAMVDFEKMKFYNMSLKDIAYRTSDVVQEIMDDILTFDIRDGVRGMLDVFIKEDRLVYLGLIIIVVGIVIALVRTTDATGSSQVGTELSYSFSTH